MNVEDFELLLPKPAPDPLVVPRWGVVTQASPLFVQLAGDAEPLAVNPKTLTGGLVAGDAVWCVLQGRDLLVVGRLRQDEVSNTNYGALSGSGGTTTGGYEKKANGRLTCWIRCRISPTANANTSRTWTFPVPFVAQPSVVATASTTTTTVQGAYVTSEDTTSGGLFVSSQIAIVRSNTADTYVNAIAEGCWR